MLRIQNDKKIVILFLSFWFLRDVKRSEGDGEDLLLKIVPGI